jgi:hypothetical protein
MPCPDTDRHVVLLNAVADPVPVSEPREKIVRADAKLWAVTKSSPAYFTGKKRADVGVKMPPC